MIKFSSLFNELRYWIPEGGRFGFVKIKHIRNIQKGTRIARKLYLDQEKVQKAVDSIKKLYQRRR